MNARKSRQKRRQEAPPASQRNPWIERGGYALVAVAVIVAAASILRIGGTGTTSAEAGPVHVHGLGIDSSDGSLFIATHTGLFRVGAGESKAARVGDSFQDTMGFTVVGESQFLGSGHPDLRTDLPPLLGLLESTDHGRSWEPISLLGEADFHVLRSAGEHVYGYDASNDRLLTSDDAGRTWADAERPAPIVDLVVDPEDSRHVLAAAVSNLSEGLYESNDGAQTWNRVGDSVGYLAWPDRGHFFLVDGGGDVFSSSDGGAHFEHRGSIGGQPAALLGQAADELYVALHDGTIKRSSDGGTWTIRSTP